MGGVSDGDKGGGQGNGRLRDLLRGAFWWVGRVVVSVIAMMWNSFVFSLVVEAFCFVMGFLNRCWRESRCWVWAFGNAVESKQIVDHRGDGMGHGWKPPSIGGGKAPRLFILSEEVTHLGHRTAGPSSSVAHARKRPSSGRHRLSPPTTAQSFLSKTPSKSPIHQPVWIVPELHGSGYTQNDATTM